METELNPYHPEIFFFKPRGLRGFFQLEIIINVLVWIPMLWVYDHYNFCNTFNATTVFRRQNLTFVDVRFWRVKTVPVLRGLKLKVSTTYIAHNPNRGLSFLGLVDDLDHRHWPQAECCPINMMSLDGELGIYPDKSICSLIWNLFGFVL